MTLVSRAAAAALDTQLRVELWRRIAARLAEGRTLVTRPQFLAAVEAAYRDFTGQAPPQTVRGSLGRMVDEVHAAHPETYLARGFQNAVERAFGRGVERLAWNEVHVQRYGSASVRRFLRQGRIRGLLHEIRLDPELVDIPACVRTGAERARRIGGAPSALVAAAAAGPTGARPAFIVDTARPGAAPPTPAAPPSAEGTGAAPVGPELTGPELAGGELTGPDAGWVQAFAGLQRLRADIDPLLRLLLRHREHVVDDAGDRTPLMTDLLRTRGCLDLALAVLERTDPELERLAGRQAPYDAALPEVLDRSAPLTVTEAFLRDLRRLRPADYAARLRAPDPAEAERARGDLRGLVLVLDHLLAPTPFRQKVRLLLANRALQERAVEVERIYGTIPDLAEARQRSEGLLTRALSRLLTGATADEAEAARRRAKAVQMAVEQKLELGTAGAPAGPSAVPAAAVPPDDGDGDDDEAGGPIELTDIELRRGAQQAQVAVRVDGKWRQVSGTIMPAPEDSVRFVLARRDPASGQLAPQQRRGRPRFVDRQPDGTWRALTG